MSITRITVGAIRAYQSATAHRLPSCRYLPSCSEYAREAVEVHGLARGALLTSRRLLRCRPWGGHGVDPVPDAGRNRPRSAA